MKAGVPRHQTLTMAVAWTTGVHIDSRAQVPNARDEWAPAPAARGVAVLLASKIVS